MLPGEAFDFLLAFAWRNRVRPDPRELSIINRADVLFFQFRFDSIGKLSHGLRTGGFYSIFRDNKSSLEQSLGPIQADRPPVENFPSKCPLPPVYLADANGTPIDSLDPALCQGFLPFDPGHL